MPGGIGTRHIATRYPNVDGLIAGTTRQTGHKEWLEPQFPRSFRKSRSQDIADFPSNSIQLETGGFVLLMEDNKFVGLEDD